MLSGSKLKEVCDQRKISAAQLAKHIVSGKLNEKEAVSAVKNWQSQLYKPAPSTDQIEKLANGLGVEVSEISEWRSSYMYAPSSPRKARLVTQLIAGLPVQHALDTLKFTNKRAAEMVSKTLMAAIADADEQAADVESLYVAVARVDGAGRRIGTKGFIPKDRGRAHPIRKEASHIHVTVTEK